MSKLLREEDVIDVIEGFDVFDGYQDRIELLDEIKNIPSAWIRCNKCKYYEGVHNVQGVAPCKEWNAMVIWNESCTRAEEAE